MLKAVVNSPVRSGDQTINDGNLIIGTASKGVDFSATAHAAGMTSEVFSDYEEGTWTPVDASNGGITFTGTSGNCFYTKVGRQVTCHFALVYSSNVNGNGSIIGGLPFAPKATSSSVAGGFVTYTNANTTFTLLVADNASNFTLYAFDGNGVANSTMSGKILRGCVTYIV